MALNSDVVSKYYNSLKESGLTDRNKSKILYLRNFNNWVKGNLIQSSITAISENYREIRVLDMGSGKGGDQFKWDKKYVSHVTFLDIAELSIEQSKERYNKSRFKYSADFIVADFAQDDFEKIIKRNYHIISCQFAFHYSFETYDQANLAFKNISSSLHESGYFIGTTINAYGLMKRLKESDGKSFGNDVFKVVFPPETSEDNVSLFGSKYNFYLEGSVDCPEFVVYPPLMDKLAEQYNLKLIERSSFPEFYQKNSTTREGRFLISKMKALQEFRINELDSVDKNEYPNVADYADPSKYHKVLMMSKSEWEVIQLYDVFIYQKI